ncbi:hypothetical protein [[Clostridium] fimetarium]|uniref:Uncharacterized protein n=1 Tax=[Clostridium] fimetarium TaxID=99656 RepID=A0A1I0RCY1_9FIRM|nr:hypothetical protein [[Clostridium] fimetarium]SEW38699.1 hypothetical protein SAMN05421659_11425 [[Clostridium] fimetarium]
MSKEELLKIVKAVTAEGMEHFDRNKTVGYGLANRTLIPFATLESHSRVVRSEGTDEDHDVMICFDDRGWILYDSTVQVGAGVQKIIEDNTYELTQESVVNKYYEMSLIERMHFIHKAYDILFSSSHRSDLN